MPRRKHPEQLHVRQPDRTEVPDIEQAPLVYIAAGLIHLKEQMERLAKMAEDRSNPVDEYWPQTLAPEAETVLTLQPQYEFPITVTSILVSGPAGSVTLQLGDRVFALTIPATGLLVVAPVMMNLGRSDIRQLTAQVAGEYVLELMGYGDNRGGWP